MSRAITAISTGATALVEAQLDLRTLLWLGVSRRSPTVAQVDELHPGFNLSESWVTRLLILDLIADLGGDSPGRIYSLGPLFEGKDQAEQQMVAAELDYLADRGWLRLQKALAWEGWSATTLPAGVEFIEAIRAKRGSATGRRQAARDALLQWAYEENVQDREPSVGDIFQTLYAVYYGIHFTAQEMDAATTWLQEKGLIVGVASFGPGGLHRIRVTPAGEDIAERGFSVNAVMAPTPATDSPVTINVHNSTGVNVAANSPGATQTATVTMTADNRAAVLKLADAVEQYLPHLGLAAPQVVEAQATARDLRDMAQADTADRTRLSRLIDAVKGVAIGGTGGALGDGLVALAQQTAQLLGLTS
jgi:hypothetical protein